LSTENQRIPKNTSWLAEKSAVAESVSRPRSDFYRSRIRERGEHLRNRLPYMTEALGQELGISVPQLDIVGCSRTGFEPNSVANHERGRLRFGFADSAWRAGAPIAAVQEFMREFVRERRKLFRRQLAGKQGDAAAAGGAARGRDLGWVFDGNSLRVREGAETLAVLAWVALHDGDLRQLLAIGLADIT
jgi:hypothetical protein